MSDFVYLYGFVPSDTTPAPPDLRGLGDSPVSLLDMGAVQAVLSHVSDPQFHVDQIERRLTDLDWVGEQGLAHERVVAWFVDHADILPARLFTMYSSETVLRDTLAPRVPTLAERLRAFAGRHEWDLKVAFDAAQLQKHGAAISPDLRALADQIEAAQPGRRYLLQRKRADLTKREVRRLARQLAEELFAALSTHALDTRLVPLSPELAIGTVVLRAALLVDRTAEPLLRQEADQQTEKLTALGMIVNLSGPWAPYRFVDNDGVA